MKTRLLLTLTALLLALSSWANGTKIDGIHYELDSSTKTASVTYTGSSSDHNPSSTAYTGSITIPASVTYSGNTYSVTSIGERAFYFCTGLTSITIPSSVTSIGKWAFFGCSGLTSINIPNSVTSIEERTFLGCTGLTSITIPSSVTSIGDYAFYYCTGLTSITIPSSVRSIGGDAFWGCTGLTSITIPSSVTSIEGNAFSNCTGLSSIKVEAGNKKYDSRHNCNAIIETASNTLVAGCKTTTIPSSVTSIGGAAFSGCTGLSSITIPSSVTSIGKGAFSKRYLTSIEVEAGNTVYDSRDNCNAIIETASNTLLFGCINTTIPSSVTSIGDGAFSGCPVTSITIPSSVTSIGDAAFGGCTGLTSITIPSSVTSIGIGAFSGCTGLTSLTIGNSVTSIGEHAFYWCESLTSITIPASVTTIGDGAFADCYNLASIKVEVGNTTYDSRENCNALIETASNTLIVGGNKAFIPSSVTTIGERAFSFRKGLTSITIPNSVTSIVPEAFYVCYDLTTVTIPESVTSIGYDAFRGCESLTDIYALRTDPEAYQCDTHTFGSVPFSTCTLHVPVGSKEAYASTAPWSNFTNIVEEDFTGIQPITLNPSEAGATYYNLQGQRIATPQRGQIVIVRYSNGTSRKMLVQ